MIHDLETLFGALLAEISAVVITADDEPIEAIPEGYAVAGILSEDLRKLHSVYMQKLERSMQMLADKATHSQKDFIEFRNLRRESEVLFAALNRLIEPLLPPQATVFCVCTGWQIVWAEKDPEEEEDLPESPLSMGDAVPFASAPETSPPVLPSAKNSRVFQELTSDPPSKDTMIH